MPQQIQFEGTTHVFPDDFSDDDIQSALASAHPQAHPKADTPPKTGFLQALGEGPLSMEHLPPSGIPPAFDKPVSERIGDIGRSLWPGMGTAPNSPILNAAHAIPIVGPGIADFGHEVTDNPRAAAGHAIAALATPTGKGSPTGGPPVSWLRDELRPVGLGPQLSQPAPYPPTSAPEPGIISRAATHIAKRTPLIPGVLSVDDALSVLRRGGQQTKVASVDPGTPGPRIDPLRTAPAPPPNPYASRFPEVQQQPRPTPPVPPPASRIAPAWQSAEYPAPQAKPVEAPAPPAALLSGRVPGPARVLRGEAPAEAKPTEVPAQQPNGAPPAPVGKRVARGGLKPPGSKVSTIVTDPDTAYPEKIVTDDGVRNWAASNGMSEADATDYMKANGYSVMGRSELNRLVHGAGAELGLDHSALSDISRMGHNVNSMAKLTVDQMLEMYQKLIGQPGFRDAIKNKTTQTQQQPSRFAHGGIVEPAPDPKAIAQHFARKGGIDHIMAGNHPSTRQTASILRQHNPRASINVNGALSPNPNESPEASAARVLPHIRQAYRMYLQNPKHRIAVVTHDSPIAMAHGWVKRGMPADNSADPVMPEHKGVFRLAPGKKGKPEINPLDLKAEGKLRPGVFLIPHPDATPKPKQPSQIPGISLP